MTQAMANLQMQLGVLTPDQAASLLPVPPVLQALALYRLVARGAIPAMKNAMLPTIMISAEAMKRFLQDGAANGAERQSAGLPAETLLPLSKPDGEWVDLRQLAHLASSFLTSIGKLIESQMPPTYEEMVAAENFGNTKWGKAASTPGDTSVPAVITPEITALVTRKVEPSNLFPMQGAELFKNLGELYLVTRIQAIALQEARDRAFKTPSKSTLPPGGLATLYAQRITKRSWWRRLMR